MILHLIAGGSENHPVYQELQISNNLRQYDFLRSIVSASIQVNRLYLSVNIIKALNYHAISCLHISAGEYRPCEVTLGATSKHTPPPNFLVESLIDDFVAMVNRAWESTDSISLAAYVLWQLNHIHPFINGNGRTARAACYFVLCLKAGGWLPGKTILPELIHDNRANYVSALEFADAGDMNPLIQLLQQLIQQQIASADPPPSPPVRRLNKRILNARQTAKKSL